jgi:hypothetical protein
MKPLLTGVVCGLLLASPVYAAETLAHWAETIEERDTQQKILSRIFSADIGPASDALLNKETGIYLFPKSGSWVRLGKDYVLEKAGGQPYFVVSCMFYNRADRPPINAASYLFRNTTDRPAAISGGYASHERVQSVKLPKIDKTFLVLVDGLGETAPLQWSAFLLKVEGTDRPKSVWNSPISAREFQFGFDALGGATEALVFRATKGGNTQYSAYRWNGDRFEIDSFASEGRIKALPDDVWRFGALQ